MSTMSEDARKASKSKAERLVRADPRERVDASGYTPDGAMDADVQTGPRPISRRQYRRGGKVAGESGPQRADRKPRASGGLVNALINRDVKKANEERDGIKHVGGMKTGGNVHSDEDEDRKLIGKMMHEKGCKCAKCCGGRVGHAKGGPAINDGTRPTAGRLARKGGGRTKGKTNVNIIITQPGGMSRPPVAAPMASPAAGPIGLRQGVPPPAPMAPAGAPAPAGVMPMPRASGGRAGFSGKLIKPTSYPIESGAGGGLGRLEKAKAARP